jgi:rubrerythrin
MLMLLEKRAVKYPSSYQVGYNIDNNIVSTIKDNVNTANKNNVKYTTSHHKKHFLLCEACFWCATYLINDITSVSKCPICNNVKVEFLPIANDLFDH